MHIIILGAGISGLATALALTRHLASPPDITIVELRAQLSTVGGATGLTPNALRALNHLGVLQKIRERGLGCAVGKIELFDVYSGGLLGTISFEGGDGRSVDGQGEGGRFRGLRIMRRDLVEALLKCVQEKGNVKVLFGRKTVGIEEEGVRVRFEGGEEVSGDVLVGCDGVHSVVRRLVVEEGRVPVYTGIAAVYGFTSVEEGERKRLPWDTTGLCQSMRGSLLCSFCDEERKEVFIAAITETEDVQSKEGWRARGDEQEKIKKSVWERYSSQAGGRMACLDGLIERSRDWTLYPVYKLDAGGEWSGKRTILLGDAAHAMPPQGESSGIALEDAILFARVMAATEDKPVADRFAAYESLRRPHTDKAHAEASWGWETQKDSGWFAFKVRCWLTTGFLWWTAAARRRRYEEDIASLDLGLS